MDSVIISTLQTTQTICAASTGMNCRHQRLVWCTTASELNASKTEVVWFGSTSSFGKLSQNDKTVVMDNENILPADNVRDLGAYLDPELSMWTHVLRITQVCFYQLHATSATNSSSPWT